jgi:hypothetical protein
MLNSKQLPLIHHPAFIIHRLEVSAAILVSAIAIKLYCIARAFA